MSDQIATSVTEIIEHLAIDVNGAALTGLTDLKIEIRRASDGFRYDFNDSTFKNSGWTTPQQALTETSAANEPGWYRYTWTVPAAADTYTITVRQVTLTNCANVPASGCLRAGGFVDTIATNLNAKIATDTGTAQAGAASSITLASGASSTDNLYRFLLITITGGTGAGQTRLILAYTGSTKVAVVNRQWQTTPDNTSTYALSPASAPGLVTSGFAQAGGASTITLTSFSSATDDVYVGETVWISGGTGFGQERVITAYNGTTKVATVDRAWTTNPDSTSTYEVYPFGRVVVTSNLDKTGYTASVGSGGITSSSFAAGAIDAASIATDAITSAKIAAGAITSSEAPALANLDAAVTSRAVAGDAMTLADGAITAAKFAAGAIDAAAIATDAIDADALKADAVAEIQSGLATSAAVAAVQADTDDIQARLPAALIGGRLDVTVGAMQAGVVTAAAVATDAIDADALAASAVSEIQSGLATSTNVSDAQAAVLAKLPAALVGGRMDASVGAMQADVVTSAAIAAGAIGASEAPLLAHLDADVSSRLASSSYTAPPSAAAISAQVAADLATAHGAGSWVTASVAGLATGQDVLDAVSAIEAYGQLHWITATGFAVVGDAMTLTAGERTAIQAKIVDDATPFHGASIAVIRAFGAPPSAAANAAAVWATAEGGTEGDMLYALTTLYYRQICRRKLGIDGYELIYGPGGTVVKKVRVLDVNGDPVAPSAGDPAEVTAEQDP